MKTRRHILRHGFEGDLVLLWIDHPDGAVRVTNGYGVIDHDGAEWFGMGRLGAISIGETNTETQITRINLSLSGIDPETLKFAEANVRGRVLKIWKAFLSGPNKVALTELILEAVCDQITHAIGEDGTATVKLDAEAGFYFLETQSTARWDSEAQRDMLTSRGLDPDSDTGFDRMSELARKEVFWSPE